MRGRAAATPASGPSVSEAKLFVGPRIRRMRQDLGITQTAMARELGISASYLNLIERNQRPLTAQVLVKLAAHYQIDPADLDREGSDGMAALREAFSDPLLAGEIASPRELVDVAEAAPNVAEGVGKLHRAYREALDRLSDLSGLLATKGVITPRMGASLPVERFRVLVEPRPHHYPDIDAAAEALAATFAKGGGRMAAITQWLEAEHRITVSSRPAATMPFWTMHHDRHRNRILLSEALSAGAHLIAVAGEAMQLHAPDTIEAAVGELARGESEELRRLLRAHVVATAGHALAMPYGPFHEMARRMRYDCGALAAHFRVSFSHAARRLVSLQRINASAPPFFMMLVDGAGNTLERLGATGFPTARFGGGCAKLPVRDLAGRPSESRVRRVRMPDGALFTLVSHGLQAQPHGHDRPMPRRAVMLGVETALAEHTVYDATAATRPEVEIGLACRLCERQACPVRAEPAITRPAGLNKWILGATPWDFE